MTLEELEDLIKRAEGQLKDMIYVARNTDMTWSAILHVTSSEDVCGVTRDEVVAKLREWATPPKPDQFTITLSRQTVEDFAKWHMYNEARHVIVETVEACKKALEPWNTP